MPKLAPRAASKKKSARGKPTAKKATTKIIAKRTLAPKKKAAKKKNPLVDKWTKIIAEKRTLAPTKKAAAKKPAPARVGGRPLLKVPSRKLKCDRNKPGDRKPVKGVYESREYRRPQKGFDLPVPGKMVLDVGAHIGWFTLWCLDHGASAVAAVEADPRNAALHQSNFAGDPRVTSYHAAVVGSEKEKTATFQLAPNGETWRNSLTRYNYYKTKGLRTVTVPCMTVAALLKTHPTVHTVKIDIEGAEMEVLETVVWPEHVRVLVFEYSCASRACSKECPASLKKGCGAGCAKIRWWAIEKSLKGQGFAFDYSESTKAVLMGLRPAIYDVVLMGKRKNYQK